VKIKIRLAQLTASYEGEAGSEVIVRPLGKEKVTHIKKEYILNYNFLQKEISEKPKYQIILVPETSLSKIENINGVAFTRILDSLK